MGRCYKINGKLYVSVTTALGIIRKKHLERWRGSVGNRAADEVFNSAGDLGSSVHNYCERISKGEDIGVIEDEKIYLMAMAYKEWFDANVRKVLFVERVVYHDTYRYAGRVDMVAIIKGDRLPSVIDFKTGNVGSQEAMKEIGLQLSGYKEALLQEGIKTKRRVVLHIDKHNPGKINAKEPPCDHTTDFNMFLYALQLHNHFSGQEPGEIIKLGGKENVKFSAGE